MTDFLNDSQKKKNKEHTVVYRHVEKETILIEQVFNMLFEMVEENNNPTDWCLQILITIYNNKYYVWI